MRKPRILNLAHYVLAIVTISAALLASGLGQGASYKTYSNARFKYSISYPGSLLLPQGEAENGDGQVFRARDGHAEMRVYGRYNVNNETLQRVFSDLTREWGDDVTYKVMRANWFVVTALVNGKIHYQKTLLRGDTFKTFEIEYDSSQRKTYDPVTARIAKSFSG